MGWHDDENQWLPAWTVVPMLWLACLLAPIMPALVIVAIWSYVAHAPTALAFAVYGLLTVLMLATIKPWAAR
jgi:hypothetical protein